MLMLLRLQLAVMTCVAAVRSRLARLTPWHVGAQRGQAFLEYALVLAVVAVIVLVAAQALGADLAAVFNRIRARLGSLG